MKSWWRRLALRAASRPWTDKVPPFHATQARDTPLLCPSKPQSRSITSLLLHLTSRVRIYQADGPQTRTCLVGVMETERVFSAVVRTLMSIKVDVPGPSTDAGLYPDSYGGFFFIRLNSQNLWPV